MRRMGILLPLALALVAPRDASAQESGHIGLVAGVANWDLSGTGDSPVFGVRVGSPLNPNIGWEINVSYMKPDQQFGSSNLFIPELQFQLQHSWGGFTPYLGVGAGAVIDKPEDDTILGQDIPAETDFSPSASLGARIRIVEGLALQAEGRLHGVEIDFTGTITELTGGIAVSF